jgi:uncharacterized protein YndB with AHSA1/START domain
MPSPTTVHSTFVIERSYPAKPERVFAAFADPAKKRQWFAVAEGHDLEEFSSDFKVGGSERARYRLNANSPFPGVELASDGTYQDIVPNRRIVTASSMAMAGHIFSSSLVTIELLPTAEGTDLICTHQGAFFENSDGPERREGGWRKLLDSLGKNLAVK